MMNRFVWIRIALVSLGLIGLAACSSADAPKQQPMSENMASRILSKDMNKRSSFETAMVSQNSGMGSYMEKQGYKSKSYTRTHDFNTPKTLKQKEFVRSGESNALGLKAYDQTPSEGHFTKKGFTAKSAREGSQVARQQGQAYNAANESFRTRSVSDAAKSQSENIRPLIIKPDGPVSDGTAYSEEDIRRLVNRN